MRSGASEAGLGRGDGAAWRRQSMQAGVVAAASESRCRGTPASRWSNGVDPVEAGGQVGKKPEGGASSPLTKGTTNSYQQNERLRAVRVPVHRPAAASLMAM